MFTAILGLVSGGLKLANNQKQSKNIRDQYLYNTEKTKNNYMIYILGIIFLIGIIILIVKMK